MRSRRLERAPCYYRRPDTRVSGEGGLGRRASGHGKPPSSFQFVYMGSPTPDHVFVPGNTHGGRVPDKTKPCLKRLQLLRTRWEWDSRTPAIWPASSRCVPELCYLRPTALTRRDQARRAARGCQMQRFGTWQRQRQLGGTDKGPRDRGAQSRQPSCG